MNHALEATGRKKLPAPTISRFVGDGARTLCARAAGLSEADEELEGVLASFLDYYVEHPIAHTRWMPYARDTLDQLRGYPIALCTNKARRVTDAVLSALGVRSLFAAVLAGGDIPEKKPAPAPILAIAKQLELAPERLVVIGDGPQDVEAGRRAGARTVGVLGGFLPRERLVGAHPDVVLGSLSELPAVIERWKDATVRTAPKG